MFEKLLFLLLVSGVMSVSAAPVIYETDFAAGGPIVEHDQTSKGFGYFKGPLPSNWSENFTHWKDVSAESMLVKDRAGDYWRLTVKKAGPQLCSAIPGLEVGKFYRLTVTVRNATDSDASLYVRMIPNPWQTSTSMTVKMSPNWKTVTHVFKWDNPAVVQWGLYWGIAGAGTLDLKKITLEEISQEVGEHYLANLVKRLSPEVKNYFRNTRLPLGLQSGWCYLRSDTCNNGVIEPADELRGPSGEKALKLTFSPGEMTGLSSEPFNVSEVQVLNAVSFAYQGTGNYEAAVVSEQRVLGKITLTPSATWKRAVVTFKPLEDSRAFALHVMGTGTLYLDAFRASTADHTDYVPAGECEVALALPESETSGARIQFPDEKPVVNFLASGDTGGATLKCTVTNIRGERKELPPVALSAKPRTGVIDYLAFPHTPYGQFRIEVQAYRNGKAVSPANELVVTRIVRPVYWGKDAPDSPFGTHVLAFDNALKAIKASGMNWARLHDAGLNYIGWFWLEPEKGKWQFQDDYIMAYRKNHIKIFGQFGTAPKWASYLSKVNTERGWISYHDHYFQPLNQEDFGNYVATVVTRYKGIIDDWFIWNEPFNPAWWGRDYNNRQQANGGYIPSNHPQADFATLSKTAYLAAKKANPKANVCGFATTGSDPDWTKGVYDAGGLEACDAIDFHYYCTRAAGFPGDDMESALNYAVGYIKKMNGNGQVGKPVIMSEGQCASTGGGDGGTSLRYAGMYKNTVPWDNQEDYDSLANYNVRYFLSLLSLKVKRIFTYSAHCYQDLSAAPSFLVMFTADGFPHPMLAAHSAMASRLEDMAFIRTVELRDDVWAYLFSNRQKSVAVISGKLNVPKTKVSCSMGSAKAADLYGNPLDFPAVYDGKVFYIEAACGADQLGNSLSASQ